MLDAGEAEPDLCLVGLCSLQSGLQVVKGASQPPVLILH